MMQLRRMMQEDIPELLHIIKQAWGEETARSAHVEFNESFSNAVWKPVGYVVSNQGCLYGCATYTASWLNYGIYDLAWVCIHEKYQGQGIGKLLVNKCLEDIKAVGTLVALTTDKPEYYTKHWNFKSTLVHNGWTMMHKDLS